MSRMMVLFPEPDCPTWRDQEKMAQLSYLHCTIQPQASWLCLLADCHKVLSKPNWNFMSQPVWRTCCIWIFCIFSCCLFVSMQCAKSFKITRATVCPGSTVKETSLRISFLLKQKKKQNNLESNQKFCLNLIRNFGSKPANKSNVN